MTHRRKPLPPTQDQSALQSGLEHAESDVPILVDSCASAELIGKVYSSSRFKKAAFAQHLFVKWTRLNTLGGLWLSRLAADIGEAESQGVDAQTERARRLSATMLISLTEVATMHHENLALLNMLGGNVDARLTDQLPPDCSWR